MSLNAPFGARCFLAWDKMGRPDESEYLVLMHLLALGAFWREGSASSVPAPASVLMHLLALGAF